MCPGYTSDCICAFCVFKRFPPPLWINESHHHWIDSPVEFFTAVGEHLSTWIPLGQWCLLGQSVNHQLFENRKAVFFNSKNPTNYHNQKKHPGGDHFQLQYAHWKISKHMTILDDHRVLFISDASVGSQASLAFVAGADAQACLGWTQRLFQDGRDHHLRSPIFMAGIPMMSNTRLFLDFWRTPGLGELSKSQAISVVPWCRNQAMIEN